MERSTVDFSVILHEEIFLHNSPPGLGDIFHRFLVFLRDVLPAEERTILADSVDL